MPRVCQLGSLFKRCHNPVTGVCQYCGRNFCAAHGKRLEDGEEICTRQICRDKLADLREHLIYREAALARSARGFCAVPECPEPRWGQCSKCEAIFCQEHLHDRDEGRRSSLIGASTSRPSSFCDHCLARRKLWARM